MSPVQAKLFGQLLAPGNLVPPRYEHLISSSQGVVSNVSGCQLDGQSISLDPGLVQHLI